MTSMNKENLLTAVPRLSKRHANMSKDWSQTLQWAQTYGTKWGPIIIYIPSISVDVHLLVTLPHHNLCRLFKKQWLLNSLECVFLQTFIKFTANELYIKLA